MDKQFYNTTVEAECKIGFGQAEVVRKHWDGPIDISGAGHQHHLELSLLPMTETSQGCFVDHWGPHRFEPFGDVFLLPAQQLVRAKSDCRHQNSIVCRFDPLAVEKWFGRNLEWTDCRLQSILNIGSNRIRHLLFQMGGEIRTPGLAGETMVELMAAQIAIELTRFLQGIEEDKHSGGLSPWRLNLIDERLDDISSQPSLGELAALCDLSVRHLTRAFRISRGRSIGDYIAEQRADHAKRLIASGMSVKSVAYTMGFSAPSNFTAAFVRATGETPRQYRLRVAGGVAKLFSSRNDTH